jgi:single-strand DNA-binding protein
MKRSLDHRVRSFPKQGNILVEFHRIVAWDKLAEVCHQYLKKGRKVYLEGQLQTRSYKDKDGIEKTVTEVVLDEMVMLGSMPKAVKESLEVKDASDSANSQQL